jgi:alanine or glycine:cation symporter, AGCS family
VSGIEKIIIDFANLAWGTPLLVVLIGGGLFFTFYLRFIPFRMLGHTYGILRGRYDNPEDAGQINHYQAVSTALASTIGMGNVSGVAVAIATGGPGAIFWMWVSALVGVTTKFVEVSLSVMYRGKDSEGNVQGGPMYYIINGLGAKWKPMALFFALMGMIGVSPFFQANQLTRVISDVVLVPNGLLPNFTSNLITGILIAILVALVVLGGIKRIGKVAGSLVPFMIILYFGSVVYILALNYHQILPCFALIFHDAFTASSVLGGALGTIIITGVRRASFSNEAGIGTSPMAHGETKTNEPIREGLAAAIEPIADTIVVCTLTALAIIITGVWNAPDASGITITVRAFSKSMPLIGPYILSAVVFIFAFTTLFAFPYYGTKCFKFIFPARFAWIYLSFYILAIIVGATSSLGFVISIFDGAYAMMAFPNMIAAIILVPRVVKASREYYQRYSKGR